jgi:hypothetical protein
LRVAEEVLLRPVSFADGIGGDLAN